MQPVFYFHIFLTKKGNTKLNHCFVASFDILFIAFYSHNCLFYAASGSFFL